MWGPPATGARSVGSRRAPGHHGANGNHAAAFGAGSPARARLLPGDLPGDRTGPSSPIDVIVGVTAPATGVRAHAWLNGDRVDPGFVELCRFPAVTQ